MDKKGTTKSLGNKHILDKFYTKEEVAKDLIHKLDLKKYSVIIEPSAGCGAFSYALDDLNWERARLESYDLEPEGEGILKQDWFLLDKTPYKDEKVLVVGNPPFGNNGSLAMKFIKESAKIADCIAFILPRGFRKESVKNRIPLNYWLTYEEDLPKNSFELEGKDYDVPCVYQVWEKKEVNREKVIRNKISEYIKFVSQEEADFRIQRVGGSAGKAFTNLGVSSSSNYFVKNTSRYTTEELIHKINKISIPSIDHTTGPRSISKGELVSGIAEINIK